MDRIPERLRTAAEGVARATQMMADAKSRRNRAAGDAVACYEGLKKEQTAEWQAAAMLERYEAALKEIAGDPTGISSFQADLAKQALAGTYVPFEPA